MQEANRCPAYERREECQLENESCVDLEKVKQLSLSIQPYHGTNGEYTTSKWIL
jgi:hypothetical protein